MGAAEMPDDRRAIREYFEKRVDCYSQAYFGQQRTNLRNTVYRLVWFPLRLTLRYTMQYLSQMQPRRVLDVGCGNGVYSLELARLGAYVTGLDSCEAMIKAAGDLMKKSSAVDRVELVCADYLDWVGNREGKYDVVLAIGMLDYTEKPDQYLASFRHMAQDSVITFPAKSVFAALGAILYRRYGIKGYSYSRKKIDRLLQQAGLQMVHFKKVFPSTYWVHARRKSQRIP
jgi:2-polyprenyl-3-methyl-5-hydroxy-6-metoxy-1,4-benzoquinol methylase